MADPKGPDWAGLEADLKAWAEAGWPVDQDDLDWAEKELATFPEKERLARQRPLTAIVSTRYKQSRATKR